MSKDLESQADALRSQKDYVSAANLYRDALRKMPKNAVLWNKLGMTELVIGAGAQGFQQTSRFNSARQDFERAAKLKKDYADAVNNLGVVYYQQGEYNKAVSRYKSAIAIRNSASFHSNLGSAYFAQKKLPLAMNEYLLALQLDPEVFERSSTTGLIGRVSRPEERAKYAFMLARLYAKVGDVDHAITQIQTALENGYKELDPLYKDQEFAAVRNDPRFAQLMENKPPAIPN
ncbi:MAG TPA: tetratricopeptide repeat protein [Terriglobales bacterium]|nr:tetratricopeptide repeat protein [Terriglobales bacterium]